MKKIKILIYKLWNKVYCWCHKKPKVVGTDDTLDKLIKDNCSISRFGDGEFSLILGGSIAFQRYDKVLEEKLREVLESESERHLVGIPNVFGNLAEFSEESRKWWENYLLGNRKKFIQYFRKIKFFMMHKLQESISIGKIKVIQEIDLKKLKLYGIIKMF